MSTDLLTDFLVLGLCFLSAAGAAVVTLAAARDAARGLREENARLRLRAARYKASCEWLLSRATTPKSRPAGARRPLLHDDSPCATARRAAVARNGREVCRAAPPPP